MALLNTTPLASNRESSRRPFGFAVSSVERCAKPGLRPLLIALALAFLGNFQALAQSEISREYQIKAGFLFNFPQFVDWPPSAFPSPEAPLVIGVLGLDPFGTFLDDLVNGAAANGHPLLVRRFSRVEEVTACHILFVSRSEAPRLRAIMAQLKGRNILTVGDVESFSRDGGMVRFLTENNKTRLRINVDAVKFADLTINSKLLRRAEIVHQGEIPP